MFNINQGVQPHAQKVLIYGVEGIGKSTLASQFPDPLFIDTEGSTGHLNVKRLDTPTSWTMLCQEVQYIRDTQGLCKTLVVDTIDWAERMCIAEVCAAHDKKGIEDFGYGSGYTYVYEKFGKLLDALSEVAERGIHVVCTAHAALRKFEQPDEAASYDRYQLKLIDTPKKSVANLVKEWADAVLFANYKTIVEVTKTGKGKAQGQKRTLYCNHHACWDAKNRWGLPDEVPMDYAQIAQFIATDLSTNTASSAPSPVPVQTSMPASTPMATPAQSTPTPTPQATESKEAGLPEYWATVIDLANHAGVTLDEIKQVAIQLGHFTADTPLENYPQEYVNGAIVSNWEKIMQIIIDNRKAEPVPFN